MSAVRWLRRRTLDRAVRSYLVWIGRAVGWATLAYLAFWLVVFATAGVESLVRLEVPLPAALELAPATLVAAGFLALLRAGRSPSVILDRRDLYRLALAPTTPYAVLHLRLTQRRLARFALGAFLGGLGSLLAPPLLHQGAPYAAPVLALVFLVHADVAWLRYAGFRRRDGDGRAARRAANALIGIVALAALAPLAGRVAGFGAGLGLLGGAHAATPLLALGLAAAAYLAVRRSLRVQWPPRFAAQSLVLTQLQAMRTLRLLAGMAGVTSGAEADAGDRARLLAALHDRPGAAAPRRFLRLPGARRPPWFAVAWRSASKLHRLPRAAQARVLLLSLAAMVGGWAAAPTLLGPATSGGAASAGAVASGGDPLAAAAVGSLLVLAAAWLLAQAGAALLGPPVPRGTLPIAPGERTRGRVTVAAALLALLSWPAGVVFEIARGALGGAVGPAAPLALVAVLALMLTVLVALEKYATWTGSAPGAWEPTLVASLVASLPVMLLGMFGVPDAALMAQLFVLTLLWWLPI